MVMVEAAGGLAQMMVNVQQSLVPRDTVVCVCVRMDVKDEEKVGTKQRETEQTLSSYHLHIRCIQLEKRGMLNEHVAKRSPWHRSRLFTIFQCSCFLQLT